MCFNTEVACELQLDFAVCRSSNRPRAVDAVRIVVRVVRRGEFGGRPVGGQLDSSPAANHDLGVVEPEPGGRLTVGVGRELNDQTTAGRHWDGRGQLSSAEPT